MPVPPLDRRHRRRVGAGALATLLALAGTACTSLQGNGPVVDRAATVVSDLATLLAGGAKLTYSADYQLAGGAEARIAQAQGPRRMAMTFPGGMLTVTPESVTDCTIRPRRVTCNRTAAPPTTAAQATAAPITATRAPGLVAPEVVVALLTATAADPEASTEQYDTTIAGQHAGCVKVARVASTIATKFTACVTADGILGSFTGQVSDNRVDVSLTRYRDAVDLHAFDVPAGATMVDRRSGAPSTVPAGR